MTRETKIGLLVGLAFIIVVAILLSDPVNNANEPPPAIADTVGSVRQSLTVPVPTPPTAPAAVQPAVDRSTTTIVTPNRAPSRGPILTRTEAAEQSAGDEVHIGPAAGPLKPIIPAPGNDNSQIAMQQGAPGQDNAVVTPTPLTQSNADDLHRAAIDGGEPLVSANTHDSQPTGSANVSALAGKQRYTAEAGDSVSKMAARLMGANTKANRAAIIAANASLKKDPNRVIVGEAYVIPVAATAPSKADARTPAPTEVAAAPTEKKQLTRWYVVKPNDNLWRIATDELGDSGAVSEIISLNKDLLKNGKALQPNMRLRLPPKSVASAD